MTAVARPRMVLLFSGKRKSGKDYVTERVRDRLGPDVCAILRLSGPLKEQYAKEHNLDFGRLLDPSGYKEMYRSDMIRWGEEKREFDPGFFCRIIVEGVAPPIWIVSDGRRRSDVDWFRASYGELLQTVRVQASDETRHQRGWVFTQAASVDWPHFSSQSAGIDDAESECGLDKGVDFDWIISNDGDTEALDGQLDRLVDFIRSRLTASMHVP